MRATITWKGEPESAGKEEIEFGGRRLSTEEIEKGRAIDWKQEQGKEKEQEQEIEWGGRKFKKGEAVEVDDESLIESARTNPFFDVNVTEEKKETKGNPKGNPEPEVFRPPSNTTSPQHPVPKGGEPVKRPENPRPPEETIGGGGEETTEGRKRPNDTLAGGATGKGPGGSTVTPPSGTPRK